MRKLNVPLSLAAAVAAAVLGSAALLLPTSSASAAEPHCSTRVKWTPNSSGIEVWAPAAANGQVKCEMGIGSNSRAVWALQHTLNACYGKSLDEDGDFGRLTKEALIDVQTRIKVDHDGIYGPQTAGAMRFAAAVPVEDPRDKCQAKAD